MKSCSSLSKRQLPRRVEKTVSTTISNFESSVPSTSSVSASLPQNNIPNSPTFNNDLVEFDSETSDTLDIEFDRLNNDTNAESSCLSDSSTDFEDEVDELRENLRKWSLDNNVTGSATSSLLKLLRNHSCFSKLPADVLSLLLTRRDFVKRNVPPGRYAHFGLERGLKTCLEKVKPVPEVISLLISVDGIPISHSSKSEYWPILASLYCERKYKPFCVGVY